MITRRLPARCSGSDGGGVGGGAGGGGVVVDPCPCDVALW